MICSSGCNYSTNHKHYHNSRMVCLAVTANTQAADLGVFVSSHPESLRLFLHPYPNQPTQLNEAGS